jgi:hypothetical protein
MTPLPSSNAGGPPQHLAGELRYTEYYSSATTIGPRSGHTAEGWMLLKLKLDPEQSDDSKTVWVDDGGVWELKGTGQQSAAPCTDVKETYSGSGTFQKWNPSTEGTGIMQVTVFNEPANMPPLLTFSVVGHIVSDGTSGDGGGCKPFRAANWWPFPTSMAGGMLQGVVDRSGGTLYITFTLMSGDPFKPDPFADVAGGYVEARP